MHGPEERRTPGNTLVVQPDKPFTGLGQFGSGFLSKFECAQCDNRLLEEVTLVDTPGGRGVTGGVVGGWVGVWVGVDVCVCVVWGWCVFVCGSVWVWVGNCCGGGYVDGCHGPW